MALTSLNVEDEILVQLIHNEDFAREVAPFLKPEYFVDRATRLIFEAYDDFVSKYNNPPTQEALMLEIDGVSGLVDADIKAIEEKFALIDAHKNDKRPELKWLIDTAEHYCQERAIYLAVSDALSILDGSDTTRSKNVIPDLLSDALATSFDTRVGHDYFGDADSRWEFYHKVEERLTFRQSWLNKITGGGLPKKTLTVLLAPTNAGKTLVKCSLAADFLLQGYNVLYITAEMAEERISERVDANLLDVPLDQISNVPREEFVNRVDRVHAKTTGRLFIREFPTAAAHAGHIRHLLHELKIKEQFIPDVIFVDYLNIMSSMRVRRSDNTYVFVKAIAEELRGLAVEQNVAVISSTQTNRGGWGASDLEMSDTSESAGLPATVDLFLALIVTEELTKMGQIILKQLKNRFSDVTNANLVRKAFNIERAKMRIEEADDSVLLTGAIIPEESTGSDNTDDPFPGFKI